MNIVNSIYTNFKDISHFHQAFPDEDSCIQYLEELVWEGVRVSPYTGKEEYYVCKNKNGNTNARLQRNTSMLKQELYLTILKSLLKLGFI